MKKSKISFKAPNPKNASGGSVLDPSLMMDATSLVEITSMGNIHYSREIIESTDAESDLDRLRGLQRDKDKFLKEGKRMLIKLCSSQDALGVHDDLFTVKFSIKIGIILSEIEAAFPKKHKFTQWVKTNFGGQHFRYFQIARQLANMGEDALKYGALGKNRLLEFERIRKQLNENSETYESLDDLIRKHPFLDITQDKDGELFKGHVDSIITYYRCKKGGINEITFDQASLMASYEKKAVEVRKIDALKKQLDQAQDKGTFLRDYIMNKMASPSPREGITVSGESLNKILADLVTFCETKDGENPDWIREQRETLAQDIFTKAHLHMERIRVGLGIAAPNSRRRGKT